jgi:2-oxo-4-hydroxy-4-carboxy-5-ureidoimidazoline decarboxylase
MTPDGSGPPGLRWLNTAATASARSRLLAVCSCTHWADELVAGRPYRDVDDLLARARAVEAGLSEAHVREALAGHRRIGERAGQGEQGGVDPADRALHEELAAGNRAYEARFGHLYLVSAAGRTGRELADLLRDRLTHDPATEARVVREELGRINALRLRALADGSAGQESG